MPDNYWTKVGDDAKARKATPKERPFTVPASKQGPLPDGPDKNKDKSKDKSDYTVAYWCPSCKTSQQERKTSKLHTIKVHCRSCGLVIHQKNEKATAAPAAERHCKVCEARLRRGNSSHYCAICDVQRERRGR